jgi:hypothetical protein
MAKKRDFQRWGKIISLIGGVLFVLGGILLFLGQFGILTLTPLANDLVIKTVLFNVILQFWLIGLIGIILGAGSLILVNAEVDNLLTGILLIIIGIFGLGIPGLFTFIGGILYIVASTRKR